MYTVPSNEVRASPTAAAETAPEADSGADGVAAASPVTARLLRMRASSAALPVSCEGGTGAAQSLRFRPNACESATQRHNTAHRTCGSGAASGSLAAGGGAAAAGGAAARCARIRARTAAPPVSCGAASPSALMAPPRRADRAVRRSAGARSRVAKPTRQREREGHKRRGVASRARPSLATTPCRRTQTWC
jgi:hypothetical protein